MKQKWYYNLFICILAILGISLVDVATPNQEIVVQFADTEVSIQETQETIAIVKKQLQSVGVDEIQIKESSQGKLTIRYYSTIDIAAIQKIFTAKKNELVAIHAKHSKSQEKNTPSGQENQYYQVDVTEIQNTDFTDTGFDGDALELETKTIRFFTPDLYAHKQKIVFEGRTQINQIAFKVYTQETLAIDTYSYKIPEVRAGPIQIG